MTNQERKTIIDLTMLAAIRDDLKDLNASREAWIGSIMVIHGLMEKNKEFLDKIEKARAQSIEIEDRIKLAVAKLGESVKGEKLHAVFSAGRISWDSKKLEGYATAHPEINEFKSVGKPSVSIRETKN